MLSICVCVCFVCAFVVWSTWELEAILCIGIFVGCQVACGPAAGMFSLSLGGSIWHGLRPISGYMCICANFRPQGPPTEKNSISKSWTAIFPAKIVCLKLMLLTGPAVMIGSFGYDHYNTDHHIIMIYYNIGRSQADNLFPAPSPCCPIPFWRVHLAVTTGLALVTVLDDSDLQVYINLNHNDLAWYMSPQAAWCVM